MSCVLLMVDKSFLEALNSTVEVELTLKGRKSGRLVSRPVWFVVENGIMYLLPVYGSKTQWYKNAAVNPDVAIKVKGNELNARANLIVEPAKVADVVDRFRSKHGADEIRTYYTKLDVAVAVPI